MLAGPLGGSLGDEGFSGGAEDAEGSAPCFEVDAASEVSWLGAAGTAPFWPTGNDDEDAGFYEGGLGRELGFDLPISAWNALRRE